LRDFFKGIEKRWVGRRQARRLDLLDKNPLEDFCVLLSMKKWSFAGEKMGTSKSETGLC
jgi:hypothetical protein